jgi:hypothetical protein
MPIRQRPKGINWSFWGAITIALLLVTSTIGYLMLSGFNDTTSQTIKYNGHSLTRDQNGVHANVEGRKLDFTFEPSQLDSSPLNKSVQAKIANAPVVYLTSDPYDLGAEPIGLVYYQIGQALGDKSGSYAITAFTNVNVYNVPVITCKNASVATPVIYLRTANSSSSLFENNCYTIDAKDTADIVMFRDLMLYQIFGIVT